MLVQLLVYRSSRRELCNPKRNKTPNLEEKNTTTVREPPLNDAPWLVRSAALPEAYIARKNAYNGFAVNSVHILYIMFDSVRRLKPSRSYGALRSEFGNNQSLLTVCSSNHLSVCATSAWNTWETLCTLWVYSTEARFIHQILKLLPALYLQHFSAGCYEPNTQISCHHKKDQTLVK